jgi:FAD/FMN-containing dehydrogenase
MAIQKSLLEQIVGKTNVFDDEKTLSMFAQDQSFVKRCRPDMMVFAETVEHIQEIVRLANRTKTPITPFSSGLNLHGASIPDQGGVLLNMSRMNKIIMIDRENWFAVVEPGVTYHQLQGELAQNGFRMMIPFGVHPNRSVLTSYMERDVVLTIPNFERGTSLIMDTEIVLPTGEIFRTGNWTCGGTPGSQAGPVRTLLYRLWTGAQGTFGIITKIALQIEPLPTLRKIFFLAFHNIQHACRAIASIQRKEIGLECFLLNNFNLAAIYAENWPIPQSFPSTQAVSDEFDELRSLLPPFVLVICIDGGQRHPEEKIAYEEEALKETCCMLGADPRERLQGIPRSSEIMLEECLTPWRVLKKFNYKGSVHDLACKLPIETLPVAVETVNNLCHKCGAAGNDIGLFAVPIERGRGLHVEIDLHCDPSNEAGKATTKKLWEQASFELMNKGAYFDRPYGAWADMVYSRATIYALKLKQLKQEMDPNNILNPGKLCFS